MKVYEKYPLPDDERRALIKTTLLSEALVLLIALVLTVLLVGFSTGDWLHALTVGWLQSWAHALAPPGISGMALLAGVLCGAILFGCFYVLDVIGRKCSAAYVKDITKLRQGVTGELVCLPMRIIVPCMLLAGFVEELCFRFALLNCLLMPLLAFGIPVLAANVIAVLITAVLFWFTHFQYRDVVGTSETLFAGVFLGAIYLLTGWIVVPMIAHALYNILQMLIEQHHARTEDDYFAGNRPTKFITGMADSKAE